MRLLVHVPLIHDPEDLGALGRSMRQEFEARIGKDRWQRHLEAMNGYWNGVSDALRTLPVDQLSLFQDGMVADGATAERIVREGAKHGSRNYTLLWELVQAGARLHKTELPELLLEEERRVSAALGETTEHAMPVSASSAETVRSSTELLDARDRSIAGAINRRLEPGCIGVCLFGLEHRIERWLDPDIRIHPLKSLALMRSYFALLNVPGDEGAFEAVRARVTGPVNLAELRALLAQARSA